MDWNRLGEWGMKVGIMWHTFDIEKFCYWYQLWILCIYVYEFKTRLSVLKNTFWTVVFKRHIQIELCPQLVQMCLQKVPVTVISSF